METIVIYPAPGFGHLISAVEFSKLLLHHSRNSKTSITFLLSWFPTINTPLLTSFIASVSSSFPSISFHTLPYIPLSKPTSEYPNREAILFENLGNNNTNIQNVLTSIALTSSVSAFIVDFFCYSSLDVSRSLNIPSYFFFTSAAYALSLCINFPEFDKVEKDSFRNVDTVFEIPGLMEVPSSHMIEPMLDRGVSYDEFIRLGEAMVKADGIIINTFDALEVKAVEGLRQGTCLPGAPIPPIYCIGPLIVTKIEDNADACLTWLDSQPSRSVVYLNFGSYGRFSKDQLMEIALGLERSMVRFLWVVREPNPPTLDAVKQFTPTHELDLESLLPEGFLDRTKERGIVVKSWAPQMEVLKHKSIGGFVTHCGWNSILEAVSFGVPMVAWPLYAEQRFNKIVLVEELKIALPMDESSDRFVGSDEVEKRIKQVMDSEEGNAVRKRVLNLKEKAKDALGEGGSSTESLAKLVEAWKREYQLITIVLPWLILSGHLCHPALENSNNSSVKCFAEERKALLQFKDGITKDYCGLIASWRSDSDCCTWPGIHCSNYTGHVTMLNLQGSDFNNPCIEGILSPSLRVLKNLRHLDLGFNYLEMNISGNDSYSSQGQNLNWLSRLSLLRYLDLSGTDLSKSENWIQIISELPFLGVLHLDECQLPWLFNLPGITAQLVYLDLSGNSLKGPIPNDFGNVHHLSHLDLSNNQLDGHVPSYFGNLHHLSYLDLSNNKLDGPVPIGFGHLHHLSHLDLSNNYLEGHIPIEFESMDSLSYLSLSNNNLQGSFKIFSRLCNFQQLDLGANNFTDEITNVIRALSKCENTTLLTLDLSQNHFWGAIPDSIKSLSMVTELDLGGNQLIGKISKGIGQLTMLEKLDLSSNTFEDTLTHTHFLNLSRLRELNLSDNPRLVIDIDASWVPPFQLDIIDLRSCKLGPSFPNWLYRQTNFSYLDVSNAKMSDIIHVSFWNSLPFKLRYLNMSCNQFYGSIHFFPNTTTYVLPEVDLSSNLFEGAIPSGFSRALTLYLNDNRFSDSSYIFCPKTPNNLIEVDLSNNLLSGKLSDCWMNFDLLFSLHLENNRFSGSVPKSIGTMNKLQYLHLHNNSFSGPIPASLENCTSLVILNLGFNSFTGNIPPWIGNVQFLGALILRRNNFLGEIPASLCQLSNLQILDFAMNHISGVIPWCISNVTAMTTNTSNGLFFAQVSTGLGRLNLNEDETLIVTWKREEQKFKDSLSFVDSLRYVKSIDFSYNELSGEIPDGIYNLTGLVSLDLSNNNMSGSISAEIGQLTALELLDLSGNHLTGNIPGSLAQLTSLAILDLSKNNLSGKIPTGTQLQGFDASSYMGNPGLCGAPLLKCPGDQAEFNAPIGNNSSSVQDKHENYDSFLLGLYISVVLGFIIGFWGVCGSLVIKRSWRHAWFRLVQDTHDRFYEIALSIIPEAWKKP